MVAGGRAGAAVVAVGVLTGVGLPCVAGPGREAGERGRSAHPPGEQAPPGVAPAGAPRLDLAARGIQDRTPLPARRQNEDEFNAYCEAVMTARSTPAEAFARSARSDVTWAHLREQPGLFRGQVVRVEGRIKRVLRFEAPSFVWSQGVKETFEAWISDPSRFGIQPVCVVFTDLPPGLALGDDLNVPAAFDGYFFKLYHYANREEKGRNTALFIGHAPVLIQPRTGVAPDGAFGGGFARLLLGFFAALAAGGAVLAWWYGRADTRVRSRLAASRPPTFPDPAFPEQTNSQDALVRPGPEPQAPEDSHGRPPFPPAL